MEVYMIGIDIAKTNFSLHAVDQFGRCVWRKNLKRSMMLSFFARTLPVRVSMESCAGSHFWGRELSKQGHQVSLIAAQFVKPFLRSQKNDRNDAEAITEASLRPNMNFVAIKKTWQQDIQSLHRIRKRVLNNRISLVNQIRGLLHEYGIVIPESLASFKKQIPVIFENESQYLSNTFLSYLHDLYQEFCELEAKKVKYDKEIEKIASSREDCKRLMQVPGVGPLTSTAFVASLGDPNHFKNGRQVGAWLGLVPKQHSSGGKPKLSGITKRGDCYLRQLLVHGARSYIQYVNKRKYSSAYAAKTEEMVNSKGYNLTSVAIANRNARVMWAMLKHNTDYSEAMTS